MIFRFNKKCFFTAMTFINFNLSNVNSLECVSMNNQECKKRSEIININTNEPLFYPYSIRINRCKVGCNTINDPYIKYLSLTMLYNKSLDIISSSDNNKTSNSCIVYIVLFSVFLIINISMAIHVYFFIYLKIRSTNPYHFGCLNINGY